MVIIKNIIFDLGGVLLNIDYNKTSDAFKNLGINNFDELFSQFKADELFEKLETGNITEDNFYQSIQKYSKQPLEVNDIKSAWNMMLLDFRKDSLSFLGSISDKYNLFLLSNTNSIHYTAFQQILQKETGKRELDIFFKKSYYSHLIKMRKPYLATYQYVLNDSSLIAKETLFIDDLINNIEAAKELGIITHHLLPGETIETITL
jgi:FMN phosphatase YigB (HAD superfamily)